MASYAISSEQTQTPHSPCSLDSHFISFDFLIINLLIESINCVHARVLFAYFGLAVSFSPSPETRAVRTMCTYSPSIAYVLIYAPLSANMLLPLLLYFILVASSSASVYFSLHSWSAHSRFSHIQDWRMYPHTYAANTRPRMYINFQFLNKMWMNRGP